MHSKVVARILSIFVALVVSAVLSPSVANGALNGDTFVQLEDVIVDTPKPVLFELGNTNPDAGITLNLMVLPGAHCSLEADSYTVTIPKGGSQLVEVTYAASEAGLCTATVLIYWYDSMGGSGWHTIIIQGESGEGNVARTVIVDGFDTGVMDRKWGDQLVSEHISECAANAKNHGEFVSCVKKLANDMMKAGEITGKQKGMLQSAAAQARIL